MASETRPAPRVPHETSSRPLWAAHERAAHYRDQAVQFQRLAEQESQVAARARLLELAQQYQGLASKLASQPESQR
jgi:hypothetical protein